MNAQEIENKGEAFAAGHAQGLRDALHIISSLMEPVMRDEKPTEGEEHQRLLLIVGEATGCIAKVLDTSERLAGEHPPAEGVRHG